MIRMIQDKVAVKADPPVAKVGLIHIPEAYQSTLWSGVVVAIGPGTANAKGRFIPTELRPGQLVVIDTAMAVEVPIDGEDYLLTREKEILGTIDDEGEVLTWKNEGRPTYKEWEAVMHNTVRGEVTRPDHL